MIKRSKDMYGTVLLMQNPASNIDVELKDLIQKIKEEKKLPFNDVYTKIPHTLFQKFLDTIVSNNLKYKDIEFKDKIFLIKF
jgi:hypothetical protein